MPSKVSVVFDADTGQFVANVNQATGAVDKGAQKVADAKNTIRSYFTVQVQGAKEAGASHEELQRIGEQAANRLASVTEQNATRIKSSLESISQKQKQVAEELKNLPVPQAGVFDEVAGRSKASALVQGIGGRASVRAGESFLSAIPGASTLLDAAFPVAGAAALTAEVVRGAEGLHKMYEEAENVGREISEGWQSITAPVESSTDALRKANDELRIADDRLMHRDSSQNQLALEMDEARIYADKLADAADNADEKVRKLFSEKSVGFTDFLVSGKTGTAPVEKELQDQLDKIRDAQDANRELTRQNPGDTAGIQARQDAIRKQYESLYSSSKNSVSVLGDANPDGKLDPAIADYRGARDYASAMLDSMDADKDNQKQSAQNKQDQATRDAQRQQQEAARKAQEAARQAAEAQRKQWQDELSKQKLQTPDWNSTDSYQFWSGKQNQALSLNKGDVQKEMASAQQEDYRRAAEGMKQTQEQAQKEQRELWQQDYDDWTAAGHRTAQAEADYWSIRMLEADQGGQNYLQAQNRYTAAIRQVQEEQERAQDARNKAGVQGANDQARIAEATVALEQQTGQISKYDAAIQLANIHTQQYATQMAALQAELGKQTALDPNSASTVNAQAAIAKAEADRVIQIQQDAAKASAEAWKTALQQANDEWMQNAQDSASQVRQLYAQSINGFNDQLSSQMTGGKTNWSGYVRGIGKTVANDGLQHLESAFGLGGKPDGSSSNPLWVRMASGTGDMAGGANSVMKGLSGLFGGGSGSTSSTGGDDSAGDDASSITDKIGGIAVDFAGGFALGGDVDPGKTITVGEMGPEEMTVGPQGAHVTPNKDLSSGGNVYYQVSVGHGVTPTEFDMKLQSALSVYHPQAMRASVAAVHDDQRRKPTAG